MTRLSYLLYRWATTLRYIAPRRLTKAGLLVATGVILCGAVGSDMDQSVAFQAFAILVCFLAVSLAWAPFFRGRFEVSRALPRLASVGQPFCYAVQVRTRSQRSWRGLEVLEDLEDPRPSYAEFKKLMRPAVTLRAFRLAARTRARLEQRNAFVGAGTLPELRPNQTAAAEMEVLPLRRGPLRFCGVTLARPDPLGLFRGLVCVSLPQTVLVLPERYPIPDLARAGGRQYQPGGVALASSVGESEEFVSLREYRPGDALRRIHWPSWARAGRPIVKEYQDEYFIRHGLVLDTCAIAGQEAVFEAAVSVAASFACSVQTQESILDFLFVGDRAFSVSTGRALGDPEQLLEILASVQPNPETEFDALQELVLRHAQVLGSCICVFVRWDEARRELVRQLRGAGLRVAALVVVGESSAGAQRDGRDPEPGEVRTIRAACVAEDLQTLELPSL
jgi:uncharacterized protein (DUF58 family)